MALQEQADPDRAFGYFALVILAIAIIGIVWLVAPDAFYKYAYAFEYDVSAENVTIYIKPKNCDWEHAPLGDKGCITKKW